MRKLDRSRPYGTVHGHSWAMFTQDDRLFDGAGDALDAANGPDDTTVQTDELNGAELFLAQVLKNGPLSKSTIYKAAETNNQPWPRVKAAFDTLGVKSFSYKNAETWKLAESA